MLIINVLNDHSNIKNAFLKRSIYVNMSVVCFVLNSTKEIERDLEDGGS